jgi:aryl-alcohol dehydrogenase-like predicted oxidoreductase
MTPDSGPIPIAPVAKKPLPLAIDGNVFGWASGIEATAEALDAFSAAGGTMISTADHYAGGRSEIMIGNWVSSRSARDRVVLATKIGRHPDAPGLSATSIIEATEASLLRLQTDYIDILSFDGDHPQTPLIESLMAASTLIASGKVRMIAASAYTGRRLREALETAREEGLPSFKAVFAVYNLMQRRDFERDVADAAADYRLGVFARLPLANGFLTGRYRNKSDVPDSVMFHDAVEHIGRQGFRVLRVLETVAAETETSPAVVALAWLRSKPGIVAPVVRASSAARILELTAAADLTLSLEQVAALDAVSER